MVRSPKGRVKACLEELKVSELRPVFFTGGVQESSDCPRSDTCATSGHWTLHGPNPQGESYHIPDEGSQGGRVTCSRAHSQAYSRPLI